jgi:hypothetical protein
MARQAGRALGEVNGTAASTTGQAAVHVTECPRTPRQLMQRPIAAASAALVCLLGITTSASAETRLERAYSANYHAVAKKHGARAPGRNIRKLGVRYVWHSLDGTRKHWATRPARRADLARSLRQLKRLLHPFTSASPPRQPPAGVLTPSTGYAIPDYIVQCESGGDPQAVNNSNS